MVTVEQQTNLELTIVSSQALVALEVAPELVTGQGAARARVIVRGAERVRAIGQVAAQARAIVREAELEQEIVPVGVALERGRVVGELELVPAVAAPEHVPVEVELELGHRRDRREVPVGTKSVTAAHPHGLRHLAVGDLAVAAAETSLEPAAAEAVTAWAVAVSAVAVVVVDVAAAVAAVADDGDNLTTKGEKPMKTKRNNMISSKMIALAAAVLVSSLLAPASVGATEKKQAAAKQKSAEGTPQPGQKQFDTPKQAAEALTQVAANFDVAAAKEILGPDGEDIISSEDPVMDKNRATAFANKAKEKMSVEIDKQNRNEAILIVGNDNFPLPIPIVKQKGKWFFDTKVGREEILNRRVGANELNAIEICRGFVEAQHEYAVEKHDGSKVNQYAQQILSTPGKHDGLAWQNPDGTWAGPVGEEVAKALQEGYKAERGTPYHGYYFKVLKGQGPAAPMGEMDFVVGGAMIGGFALAAAPAEYRVTGVMTFMVGPDGVVYEKDLGPDTLKTFQSMDKYNPDKTWKVTEDDVEDDSTDQGSESQGQ